MSAGTFTVTVGSDDEGFRLAYGPHRRAYYHVDTLLNDLRSELILANIDRARKRVKARTFFIPQWDMG